MIVTSIDYKTMDALSYTGHLTTEGSLEISSGQDVSLSDGFLIEHGGGLTISIEQCEN